MYGNIGAKPLEDKIRILHLIEQRDTNSNGTTFRYLCELLTGRESFADTVCNPIMVTLLYHCFPYMDEVPSDISEFYRQLFGVLYARHDKTKGYHSRERESEIEVEPAREFFSYICLKSLLQEEYELDSYKLHQYAETALKTRGYDIKRTDAFIRDIVKITCLLQADGNDRFVYLHKSVQEFFAAFYLSIMKEKFLKAKIYQSLRERVRLSGKYDNFLLFLFHLDYSSFTDELTLEGFRECQYTNYAEMSYDDFSLTFDLLLKDILVRGQCKKKDLHIDIVSHTSMSIMLNLGFLNIIRGNERKINNEVDKHLNNSMKAGIPKGQLKSISHFIIPPSDKKEKLNGTYPQRDSSNPPENYAFPMVDYLKFAGHYDFYKREFFDAILKYNENVYKVKLKEATERKYAINNSFDFL